ncbi:cellulase family glycosylhydrolase [Aquimarina sp. RZ0]|uniref:cellulase family glycosylhydrolase n=1 Tax=Aquimarina sp. RZ0 TaxID=2607730 RepID=UPI0011F3693A|nr:cellulase family glycosylhydrolase [Aquimarina sp. RZ0]KAA1247040.1 cellulase family glycosylhydrolase [Aquimarina sp. RZ0]
MKIIFTQNFLLINTLISYGRHIAFVLSIFISTIAFAQNTTVTDNGLLKVNGNRIENKNGQAYSVAGNSIFWSGFETVGGKFYKSEVVDHLAQNWGSQVVRAAIAVEEADLVNITNFNTNFPQGLVPNPSGSGLFNNYEFELAKAKVIIDAAIANDIYVIVDFHTHFAHHFEDIAIRFFEEIAEEYGDNDHIIYEIFNEPINTNDFRITGDPNTFSPTNFTQTWDNIIKPYAINVINAIRAIDPDNLIVVGTPGFSQGVGAAAANQIRESDLNLNGADLNLAYTLHFYAAQTEHDALIQSATDAMNQGIALFVTEWGTVAASGDGDVDQDQTLVWMDFMKENNISHANWSISDKFEGASVITGNGGVDGLLNNDLTSSGNFVKCIIENWEDNSFGSCEAVITDGPGGGDSALVPNGFGIKFEVERPTELDASTNSRIDFISPDLSIGDFDGEGILSGFKPGESVVVNANGFLPNNTYAIQIVLSSSAANNFVLLLDDSFEFIGGENTTSTSLNEYEIVTIRNVQLGDNSQNIRIAIGENFSGSMNIESFYVIPDNEYDNAVLGVPTFDAELGVSISPVPVTNNLYINTATNADVKYSIFDITGKKLISESKYNGSVNTSDLKNGIYMIQLFIDDQNQTYKFIKE